MSEESPLEEARSLARFALAAIEQSRQRIDDLNVYPVPDGDTGTNLTLTVRAVVEHLETSTAADRAAVAHELTRAALMGARGNSGVIFSQIVRGAAEVLGGPEPAGVLTCKRALRGASDAAYRAVRRPVEGTMLTVIREMAEEAEATEAGSVSDLMHAVVRRGEDALARTPELLDVLREAGVVDAGGAGLLEIVRGITAGLAGEPLPEALPRAGARLRRRPPGALALHVLHRLRDRGRRPRRRLARVRAGAARRLAARRRRPERAQGARPHRRAGRRALARHRGRHDRAGRDREHARPDRRARGTAQRARTPRAAADTPALTDVVAVVAGEGNRRLFASLGAALDHRGRPDDESRHVRAARGDRGGARTRGDRAAEQRQRDPLGRAGRLALGEARPRDPHRLDPGRARRDGGLRPERVGRGERGADARGAWRASPPAR